MKKKRKRLTKNYLSYEQLRDQPLLQITAALSDTMISSGSKALTASF